ncbi:MAG: hypothetical protein QME79_12330 [Bacillota bacterium]|nr:hypothetical protein [Bacillota bacterium]
MSVAYLASGAIELPNVQTQRTARQVIGDEGRTAGGKLRRDVVATKRVWTLVCPYLTNAEYDAIVGHLEATFGVTTFWLDEFGGTAAANSIAAVVDVEEDERVQFARDGTWHSDGHSLVLTVQEQ